MNSTPDNPFERIGLYQGDFRVKPPDKNNYPKALQEKFADRKSFDENVKYDLNTINDILYFNTGKLILTDDR